MIKIVKIACGGFVYSRLLNFVACVVTDLFMHYIDSQWW